MLSTSAERQTLIIKNMEDTLFKTWQMLIGLYDPLDFGQNSEQLKIMNGLREEYGPSLANLIKFKGVINQAQDDSPQRAMRLFLEVAKKFFDKGVEDLDQSLIDHDGEPLNPSDFVVPFSALRGMQAMEHLVREEDCLPLMDFFGTRGQKFSPEHMLEGIGDLSVVGHLVYGAIEDAAEFDLLLEDLAQAMLFTPSYMDVSAGSEAALTALDREVSRLRAMEFNNPQAGTPQRAVLNVFQNNIRALLNPEDPEPGVVRFPG